MNSKMHRWWCIIGCLLLVGVILAGCAPASTPAQKASVPAGYEKLLITGGSLGAVSATCALAMAKILMKYYPEIEWTSRSGNNAADMVALAEGRIKLESGAMATDFIMNFGVDKVATSRLRMIFHPLPALPYTYLVPVEKPWKTLNDIPKGTNLNPGTPATTAYFMGMKFLEVSGLNPKDFNLLPAGKAAMAEQWRDRKIEAAFGNVESASPWLVDMKASGRPFKVIGLTPEVGTSKATLDAFLAIGAVRLDKVNLGKQVPQVFSPQDEVYTPLAALTLQARDDFPEAIAYKMAKIFDEHLDEMIAIYPGFKESIPEHTIKYAVPPHILHPGVAKYYREKGYLK